MHALWLTFPFSICLGPAYNLNLEVVVSRPFGLGKEGTGGTYTFSWVTVVRGRQKLKGTSRLVAGRSH